MHTTYDEQEIALSELQYHLVEGRIILASMNGVHTGAAWQEVLLRERPAI